MNAKPWLRVDRERAAPLNYNGKFMGACTTVVPICRLWQNLSYRQPCHTNLLVRDFSWLFGTIIRHLTYYFTVDIAGMLERG